MGLLVEGKWEDQWYETRSTGGRERLWNGDQPVRVSNKAFQLLRLFVDNPNRLLTKDDILDGVWRDVCVSEGSSRTTSTICALPSAATPSGPRSSRPCTDAATGFSAASRK